MADNVIANPGAGGAQFRAFSDGTNEWPAVVVSYVTGGSAGAWTLQDVDSTHGLPVNVLNTSIPVTGTFWPTTQPVSIASTVNTSAAQSGTWNVTVNTALPAGSNLLGGVEIVDSAGVNKASISAAGAVKVDNSAVTQPVSGTVTANQGGTWTVQPGNTANTTPWLTSLVYNGNTAHVTVGNALQVDGSGVTQPVSFAGTMTTSDLADGPVTPGTAASKSVLIGAQYNTSAPTPTTGQQVALQTDASGNLKVNVVAGGGSGSNAAAGATGSAVPTDADFAGLNVGGTLRGQTGVNPAAGVYAAQNDLSSVGGTSVTIGQAAMAASIPVVIASNQSAFGVQQNGAWTVTANAGTGTFTVSDAALELAQASTTSGQKGVLVQGAVTTSAPTYTAATTNPLTLTTAGALRVDGSGVTQPVSGTVTANVGTTNGLALDATLTGGSQQAIPVAGTSGGATPYHLVSAASTNATSVKGSAGTVYAISAFNVNASPRYLKFFDKATAPTLGTDTPKKVIMMPGNTAGAGAAVDCPVGTVFSSGIAIAITGGIADTDATAVGASDCVINFDYK